MQFSKESLLILCTLGLVSIVHSQQQSSFFLEDMDEHSIDVRCYCKPGVRNRSRIKGIELSYQYLGNGSITSPNEGFGAPYSEYSKFRKFRTKVALPIIRRRQLKTIIAYTYDAEQFELENINNDYQGLISATDNVNFKSSSIDLSVAFSPNEINYIGGKFRLSYNGSYDKLVDFSSRYAVYNGVIVYGFKKHEDNEWGLGIAGSRNFRKQGFRILPVVFWNKTINDFWGFQITLPSSINLRFNYNEKTILLASVKYNGASYSFDQVSLNDRLIAFNHSEILTVLQLQRQIVPWLWFDLQAGYHFNVSSSFELQLTQEELLKIDLGNTVFLKLGVFISPPDKFLN